ncbi:MAG: hypothetical protein KDD51_12380 [Bdellovibrionales bacterium]|nr:hypothetical protein [Bdellovibrionales bacterium]
MKLLGILLTTLLVSGTSFANTGLESVSNYDLIRELSRRLEGGQVEGGAQATFSCSSNVMNVSLISASGEEFSKSIALDYSSNCMAYKQVFAGKIVSVSQLKIIAMCHSNRLHRLALLPGELKELEVKDLDFSSTCQSEAKIINDKL